MQKHELKRKTKRAKHVQVGRGGKRGKTAGRGHKGQKARAGHSIRPEIRDMIKKIPKLRGRGVNLNTSVKGAKKAISLSTIDKNFKAGEKVTPQAIFDRGLVRKIKGKLPAMKIVNTGELKNKVIVKGLAVSEGAKKAIEAVKGEIK